MDHVHRKKLLNRRSIIKIVGVSLFSSLGYNTNTIAGNTLNKNITTTWHGEILNAPVKVEIHSEKKI